MVKNRFKKGISKNKPNILANVSSRKYDGKINISFGDLDVSQHHQEDFKSWDKENLLLNLLNRIKDKTYLTFGSDPKRGTFLI